MSEKSLTLNASQARLRFMEFQIAFQQDCEKILLKFSNFKTFDFVIFRNIWLEHRFSLIYLGKYRASELPHFTQMCFNCVKKYLVYSTNEYIKMGAIYMLYGLYYKQPMQHLAKIRILSTEFKCIKDLMEQMKAEKNLHALYVYKKLLNEEAFEFHFTQYPLGFEMQYTQSDLDLLDDIFPVKFELANDFQRITKEKLDVIYETDKKYSKSLQEYISKKKVYIDTYPLTLREDLDMIMGDSEAIASSLSPETQDIVSTQRSTKEKAFASRDDSFWKRTKVGKKRQDIEEEM